MAGGGFVEFLVVGVAIVNEADAGCEVADGI